MFGSDLEIYPKHSNVGFGSKEQKKMAAMAIAAQLSQLFVPVDPSSSGA